MTSIIKFEPLSGACGDEEGSLSPPPSYLLQVDEFRFLLDCGWDESFSQSVLQRLVKHVKAGHIDAVLISHPDPHHLGALPVLVGRYGLNCPIFMTVPVSKMGEMFMYDWFASHDSYEDFKAFSLEDVDATFAKVKQLSYNQTHALGGKGQGITITPLPAGHMIGGTIWRICKEGEEDIIYAVDFNHKRERHLNRCALEAINKPSLLIMDAMNALYNPAKKRNDRDDLLITNIVSSIRKDGNVLVCVDTAGRCLELAYMLDTAWKDHKLGLMQANLVLLNSVATHVIEFAKSQVEWMSERVMKFFQDQRNNPFNLKSLHICQDMAGFRSVQGLRKPVVVLASQPDLEAGFSRQIFVEWASQPNNRIIITQRSSSTTNASNLLEAVKPGGDRWVHIDMSEKIPLQGLELEEYLRQKEAEKRLEEEERKRKEQEEQSDSSDSDDEEDEEEDLVVLGTRGVGRKGGRIQTNLSRDLIIVHQGKQRGRGLFKQAKKSYPMFPAPDNRVKWDDYGEIINPEDFAIFDHATQAVAAAKAYEENKENEAKNEDAMEEDKIPTKVVNTNHPILVEANVQFIDFEGRSDGESLKKIISNIKPRRLILVHGSIDATLSLAKYCESIQSDIFLDKVFTPRVGEVVDATTESHIYQVRLKDSLVSSLHFTTSKDGAQLAWVDGKIEMPEEESLMGMDNKTAPLETVKVKEEGKDSSGKKDIGGGDTETTTEEGQKGGRELLPTLTNLPPDSIPPHVTIFINEVKLSDFKQVLLRAGIQAEFSGGILYCSNQMIAIKRSEAGRIQFEGTLCEDYFKIRQLLYQQYAIL